MPSAWLTWATVSQESRSIGSAADQPANLLRRKILSAHVHACGTRKPGKITTIIDEDLHPFAGGILDATPDIVQQLPFGGFFIADLDPGGAASYQFADDREMAVLFRPSAYP